MSERLQKLYHPIIKQHNLAPINFEKIEGRAVVMANNSICGDRFEFFAKCDGERLEAISFYGFGCAVSKASSSILVKLLEGKSVMEAIETCDAFITYLNEKKGSGMSTYLKDFEAFNAIWEFPQRYECAALPWKEVASFLRNRAEA